MFVTLHMTVHSKQATLYLLADFFMLTPMQLALTVFRRDRKRNH